MTSEHPFFVRVHGARSNTSSEGEWKQTWQIRPNDQIRLASGKWARIISVLPKGGGRVYNFTVEKNHNYFVGRTRLLTHNACWNPNPRRGQNGPENAMRHWDDHRGDFPNLNNASQYAKEGADFLNNPPSSAQVKFRPNGDKIVYDPATEKFGVQRNGLPSTYFKPNPAQHGLPTNLDYFNAQ